MRGFCSILQLCVYPVEQGVRGIFVERYVLYFILVKLNGEAVEIWFTLKIVNVFFTGYSLVNHLSIVFHFLAQLLRFYALTSCYVVRAVSWSLLDAEHPWQISRDSAEILHPAPSERETSTMRRCWLVLLRASQETYQVAYYSFHPFPFCLSISFSLSPSFSFYFPDPFPSGKSVHNTVSNCWDMRANIFRFCPKNPTYFFYPSFL